MADTLDGDFINIPVPRQHVIKVYALLAQLEEAAADVSEGDETDEMTDVATAVWPVEDLRRFAETPTYTSENIGKVLDVLADRPGEYVSTTELERETGIRRLNLRGSFAALTRHTKKHYSGRGAMFTFAWGPTIGRTAEGHYLLSGEQAKAWKEARAA